jgi:hypothetical protein
VRPGHVRRALVNALLCSDADAEHVWRRQPRDDVLTPTSTDFTHRTAKSAYLLFESLYFLHLSHLGVWHLENLPAKLNKLSEN